MALSAARVTVSTVAVALNTTDPTSVLRLFITNTSANAVSLGNSGVGALTGYQLVGGASLAVELDPGDVLFAIRESADASISIVRT